MNIVVMGYRFADLAYYETPPLVEKEHVLACPVCGYDYVVSLSEDAYLKYRLKRIKVVHKKLRERRRQAGHVSRFPAEILQAVCDR